MSNIIKTIITKSGAECIYDDGQHHSKAEVDLLPASVDSMTYPNAVQPTKVRVEKNTSDETKFKITYENYSSHQTLFERLKSEVDVLRNPGGQ